MPIVGSVDFSSQIAAINDAVPSAMSKTYYVDAVNGSDTNDGLTTATAFQTIKKAIDSVPVGGVGYITLLSDYDMTMNSENIDTYGPISINHKSINLYLNYHALNVISIDDGTYSYLPAFGVGSIGCLYIYRGTINMPTQSNGLPWHYTSGFIKGGGQSGSYPAFAKLYDVNINIPANSAPFFLSGVGAWEMSTNYLIVNTTITTDTLPFLRMQNSTGYCCLGVRNVPITDSLGNALTWNDLISGIVKDANGVPRNVLSNIVL